MTHTPEPHWHTAVSAVPQSTWAAAPSRMATSQRGDGCVRCGTPLGIARFAGRQICAQCKPFVKNSIANFGNAARGLLFQTGPVGPQWDSLIARLQHDRIPLEQAFAAIRPAAVQFLERFVAFAFADGSVSQDEVAQFRLLASRLLLPQQVAEPMLARLERGVVLSTVRAGHLPQMQAQGVHLDLDETCHVDLPCEYVRVLKASIVHVPGRLLVSSKKFRFLGFDTGWELTWKKIMSVNQMAGDAIHVQAVQAKGTGTYRVADPEYVALVVETATKIDRRQILGPPGTRDSRRIAQDVKATVWQRDRGSCVECGSSSCLEYDHVIPLSRGGATSVNNLQLLCRGCNLRKGARL